MRYLAAFAGLLFAAAAAHAQVRVTGAAGSAELAQATLEALPQTHAVLTPEKGDPVAMTGPALWDVLQKGGAIDPDYRHRVAQTVTVTGKDGYTAVLALGEIDPEFEGKRAVLALSGSAPNTLPRLVVPGDRRQGRSVREVASLTVR